MSERGVGARDGARPCILRRVSMLGRHAVAALDGVMAQRARAAFTCLGIAIGVIALVTVGSLIEHLGTMIQTSQRLGGDQAIATLDRSIWTQSGADDRVIELVWSIRQIQDVAAVDPVVALPYDPSDDRTALGPPAYVFEARVLGKDAGRISRGRAPSTDSLQIAVIGSDFAAIKALDVGASFSVYGSAYRVGGILSKTYSIYDNAVIVSHDDARHLARQGIPRATVRLPQAPVTAFIVRLRQGAQLQLVMQQINRIPYIAARDPLEQLRNFQTALSVFQSIVIGCTLISLVVSALSILNTMSMAVSERAAEIGLRMALGATRSDIFMQFIIEAAILGLAGAACGVGTSLLLATMQDRLSDALGVVGLFAPTPEIIAAATAGVVVLACAAGVFPALRAARTLPAVALQAKGM